MFHQPLFLFQIEIEMLDYDFIRGCSDTKLLTDIVSVLKSGKEGYYPDVSFNINVILFLDETSAFKFIL